MTEYKPLNDPEKGKINETPDYLESPVVYTGWYVDHETQLRNQFLGKTFAALFIELLATALIAVMFSVIDYAQAGPDGYGPIFHYFENNMWMLWVSIGVMFVTLILLLFLRKKKPFNFILLVLFILSNGVMIGILCLFYTLPQVLLAFGITTLIAGNLGIYAWVSKRDFTWLGGGLIIGLTILIIWSFVAILWTPFFFAGWMAPFFSILGCIIFSGFILYDVSRIRQTHSYDEWLMASLSLYLDVINLLLYVLQLVGGGGGRR